MSEQRVAVLRALGQSGPMSAKNLSFQEGVDCKERELIKFVLPPMLTSTSDQPRLVQITSRGVSLTLAGVEALSARGVDATFYDNEEF